MGFQLETVSDAFSSVEMKKLNREIQKKKRRSKQENNHTDYINVSSAKEFLPQLHLQRKQMQEIVIDEETTANGSPNKSSTARFFKIETKSKKLVPYLQKQPLLQK